MTGVQTCALPILLVAPITATAAVNQLLGQPIPKLNRSAGVGCVWRAQAPGARQQDAGGRLFSRLCRGCKRRAGPAPPAAPAARRRGAPPPTPGQFAFPDPFRVHAGGGMGRLHSMSPAPMHAVRAQRELPACLSNRRAGGPGVRTRSKPAARPFLPDALSLSPPPAIGQPTLPLYPTASELVGSGITSHLHS